MRLQNWRFDLVWEGKKCVAVHLSCQNVTLFSNKTEKKEIRDCNFQAIIAEGKEVTKLPKSLNGYLNRLGKRNLLVFS